MSEACVSPTLGLCLKSRNLLCLKPQQALPKGRTDAPCPVWFRPLQGINGQRRVPNTSRRGPVTAVRRMQQPGFVERKSEDRPSPCRFESTSERSGGPSLDRNHRAAIEVLTIACRQVMVPAVGGRLRRACFRSSGSEQRPSHKFRSRLKVLFSLCQFQSPAIVSIGCRL